MKKARKSFSAPAASVDHQCDPAKKSPNGVRDNPVQRMPNAKGHWMNALPHTASSAKDHTAVKSLQHAGEAGLDEYECESEGIISALSDYPSSEDSDGSSTGILIPSCISAQIPLLYELMRQTMPLPPCTLGTLRELDLNVIQNNMNLRVDLCFDQDLFFQPVSGMKGEAKKVEAEKYWLSLAAEFRIHWHNAQPSCTACANLPRGRRARFDQRLPAMFATLKEIVEMLVPESEHDEVADHLDVKLLMQQITHGSLDAVRLSEWLTRLLTSHCAPVRDRLAVEILDDVRAGTDQFNMELVARGIEKLFAFLEAMALDVANHSIKTFRFPLINDTIAFQREYFGRAIKAGTIDTRCSLIWYRQASQQHRRQCNPHHQYRVPEGFEGLMHGMTQLCNPNIKKVPYTLSYDYHRFMRLQEDLQDLIQIEMCLNVFDLRALEMTQGRPQTNPSSYHKDLKSRIIHLTEDEEGNGGAICDHLDAIAFELTRAAFDLKRHRITSEADSQHLTSIDNQEFITTRRTLRKAFDVEDTEQSLSTEFLTALEEKTLQVAVKFVSMSTLEISTSQRQWNQCRTKTRAKVGKECLLADLEDMSRRLAHMGVLHWRVWGDLCYQSQRADIELTEGIHPNSMRTNKAVHVGTNNRMSAPNLPLLGIKLPLGVPNVQQQIFTGSNCDNSDPNLDSDPAQAPETTVSKPEELRDRQDN